MPMASKRPPLRLTPSAQPESASALASARPVSILRGVRSEALCCTSVPSFRDRGAWRPYRPPGLPPEFDRRPARLLGRKRSKVKLLRRLWGAVPSRHEGIIQEAHHPRNDGHVRHVEHVPVEPEGMQGEEVGHASENEPVDGVGDRTSHDQPDAPGHQPVGDPARQPQPQKDRGQRRKSRQKPLTKLAFLGEEAVADALVLDVVPVEERGHVDPFPLLNPADEQHVPLVRLVEDERRGCDAQTRDQELRPVLARVLAHDASAPAAA